MFPVMTEPSRWPPPPPQPYSDASTPARRERRNALGTWALVVAVVGVVLGLSVAGGIVLGIAAVAMGFAARARVKRGVADNKGVAVSAIVLGFLAIVVGIVSIAIWAALLREPLDCLERAGNDDAKVQQCADDFKGRLEGSTTTVAPTP